MSKQEQLRVNMDVGADPRKAGPAAPFKEKQQAAPGVESEMALKPDWGETSYVGHNHLQNKVCLITGGDSGIGRAVAFAFAKEGAKAVCFGYLTEEKKDAEVTKKAVESAGAECMDLPGDLASDDVCKKLVDDVVKKYGQIDVLCLNAATQGHSVQRFEDIDYNRVRKTFEVNIISMFSLCRYALPYMKPGSSIITTSSIQAYQPSAGILDYACTKGAIISFTKGLAQELIQRGIRVNCVAPGPVWTPLIIQSFNREKIEQFGRQESPIGRPAQPRELSPLYVFLASTEAQFCVGEVLGGTGGRILA